MYKLKTVDHITDRLNIKGDVNLSTNAGKALYSMASLPEVKNFIELGTQWGTSAECICRGLMESGGHLQTVEFIKERYEFATEALKDIPVTCNWGKSFQSNGVDTHYQNHNDKSRTMSAQPILEKLVSEIEFDAAFLDTCSATQEREFYYLQDNTNVKYILMHEPNIKCPNVLKTISEKWNLLEEGYDMIGVNNVLYTLYERK